jgi:hypothetical protein
MASEGRLRARRGPLARALKRDFADFAPLPERNAGAGRSEDVTSLVLAEYGAIRQEIQTALSNQQSSLSVGAATLGLLAAVGARFWPDDLLLGGLVFSLVIPAACAMAIRMWYGELLRIARAARFIAELERWVNRQHKARLLVWERWMHDCRDPERQGQDIDLATWRAVVLGFSALAIMSMALGMYWLYEAHGLPAVAAVALLNALCITREWHDIAALRGRAIDYLKLPDEGEDEGSGPPRRLREAS